MATSAPKRSRQGPHSPQRRYNLFQGQPLLYAVLCSSLLDTGFEQNSSGRGVMPCPIQAARLGWEGPHISMFPYPRTVVFIFINSLPTTAWESGIPTIFHTFNLSRISSQLEAVSRPTPKHAHAQHGHF